MERASKVLRRSGVRLKSLSGGHTDLNIILSELKDIRQAAKNFMTSQNAVSQDLVKWAAAGDNRAIQDIMCQLNELNALWTDVQKDFVDHLRDFKYQFEMILEGEKQVDHARNHLTCCEQRENKTRKELKRAAKKSTVDELNNLEIKLSQAERSKDLAQLEVVDRVHENEAVKLIRLKQGLLKLSDAYLEMASKCAIIFEAQSEISHQLPDVHEHDLHEIKYTGSGTAKLAVLKAKEKVQDYQKHRYQIVPTSLEIDPPPPYTPGFYDPSSGRPFENPADVDNCYAASYTTLVQTRQRAIGNSSPVSPSCPPYPVSPGGLPVSHGLPPPQPIPHPQRQSNWLNPPNDRSADIRWNNEDYEDDLSEVMGAAKI